MTIARTAAVAAAAALAVLTAACQSDGSTTGARETTPPAVSAPSSTPAPTPAETQVDTPAETPVDAPADTPADTPTALPRSTQARPAGVAGSRTLCASDTTAATITPCLRDQLSDFWSSKLNDVIDQPVYVAATAAQVPQECRGGLDAAPAFTCRSNKALYVNQSLLDTIATQIPAADTFYAFASVQAHEFGHVLQYTLHQPQLEGGSEADTRFLEQQADCLSGVWAAHAGGGFDTAAFRRTAVELVTLVSSNAEIATHGTPAQRAAAIDRGLASGRPQACALTTFS